MNRSLYLLLIALSGAPFLQAAELVQCYEQGRKVLRNDGCNGVAKHPQTGELVTSFSSPPIPQPTQVSIDQLKATCKNEFGNLAAIGPTLGRRTFNLKMALLKSRCQTQDVECFGQFDALYRIANPNRKAVGNRAAALAEKCQVIFDYDMSSATSCISAAGITQCN